MDGWGMMMWMVDGGLDVWLMGLTNGLLGSGLLGSGLRKGGIGGMEWSSWIMWLMGWITGPMMAR